MSFSDDFKMQWKSLTDYIVSDMIKSSASKGSVDYESICVIYKNEILRWTMDGQYNADWYDSLFKAAPDVAESFLNTMKDFKFDKVATNTASSAMNIAGAGIGAVAGLGVSWIIKLSTVPLIAVGICAAVVGGVAGTKLSGSKREKAANMEIDAYSKQLELLGEKLTAIAAQADVKA